MIFGNLGTNGNVSSVGHSTVSLPSFSYAVSRFKSSDWTQDAVEGMEKVKSIMHSTENWLTRLNVKHPDFIYFKNHTFLRWLDNNGASKSLSESSY